MAMGPKRELLFAFREGLEEARQTYQAQIDGFLNLRETFVKPKVLDRKTKELIGVAMAVNSHCEYCIAVHVTKAFEAGATPEEIQEAGLHAVLFGGGPALAHSVTSLKKTIEEFAPDYKNRKGD